jgi:ACS family tartrate transporter-like MFS transporter
MSITADDEILGDSPAAAEVEPVVFRKVALRLIPFLFVAYVVNILNRNNVSFARLSMLDDLGLSEAVFSFGAGVFYVGYSFFQVPSNLVLHRVGARRWIGWLIVSWGVVSACLLFVWNDWSFYALRILLGMAQAGFFPGMILYISYWFPARARSRAVAFFMMGSPVAGLVGGPISGGLMQYTDGLGGMAGWQWLFLIEGIPAVLLGIAAWFYLTDRPEQARWLPEKQRDWLSQRMAREEQSREKLHGLSGLQAMGDPRVWLLTSVYFTLAMGSNALGLYLPKILKAEFVGTREFRLGFLTALPHLVAVVAMFLVGAHSDRTGERRWHVGLSAFAAATGWFLSAYLHTPWLVLVALVLAQVGMMSMMGPFWSMATSFLSGAGAAGGIAVINTVANLGGFVAPNVFGMLKAADGSFAGGELTMAATLLIGGILALTVRHDPRAERA